MAQPKAAEDAVTRVKEEQPLVAGVDTPLLVEPGSPEWELLQQFREGKLRQEGPNRLPGYIEFGSEQHMELLGLRRVIKGIDDIPGMEPLTYEGYTLVDVSMHGPMASRQYLMFHLIAKVNELRAGKPPLPLNAQQPFIPIENRADFM